MIVKLKTFFIGFAHVLMFVIAVAGCFLVILHLWVYKTFNAGELTLLGVFFIGGIFILHSNKDVEFGPLKITQSKLVPAKSKLSDETDNPHIETDKPPEQTIPFEEVKIN